MENWAPSEPRPNRPCAYMDKDGEWKTTLCNQTYYSVCEKTTGEIQVCVCVHQNTANNYGYITIKLFRLLECIRKLIIH